MGVASKLKDGAGRLIVRGPATIHVDITTACNISCNYCFHKSPLMPAAAVEKDLHLGLDDIEDVLAQASRWGVAWVCVAGRGEPTCHPQFPQVLRALLKGKFKTRISTNAAFSPDILPALARVDDLNVTLSSPNEVVFRRVQASRAGVFARVIGNVRALNGLRVKAGRPSVHLKCVVNATNYEGIPSMVSLAEDLGVERISFRLMQPTRHTRSLVVAGRERASLLKLMLTAGKQSSRVRVDGGHLKENLKLRPGPAVGTWRCRCGLESLFVRPSGELGFCCHNSNIVIGRLKDGPVKDIWEGGLANRWRKACLSGFSLTRAPFKGDCDWCLEKTRTAGVR